MEQTQTKKHVDYDLTQFSGDDKAEMAKMYEETLKNFTEGSIVSGKVLEVRSNEVLVDIGYKSEGIIPGSEFADMTAVKPGSGAGGETSRRLGPLQGKTAFKLSGSFKMTDEEPLQS